MELIPKVIHYCWFGGKPLPTTVRRCINSWMERCPDYKIERWDESNFDINSHPFLQKAYQTGAWAFVSDYARLKIIYENGGVYLDTDVELLRNLDELLTNRCYVGVGQVEGLVNTGLGFGAVPYSPIVLAMLKQYDFVEYDASRQHDLACPYLNTMALRDAGYTCSISNIIHSDDLTIFPPRFFDPICPGEGMGNLLCDESFSVHHYSNTWGTSSERLRRRIVGFLGPKKVDAIKSFFRR